MNFTRPLPYVHGSYNSTAFEVTAFLPPHSGMGLSILDGFIIFSVIITVLVGLHKSKNARVVVPPGPKGLPLLGNIFDLPTSEPYRAALKWSKQYGDITYLHVCGLSVLFLNSAEVAIDLLDKRGAIYSDRPPLVMATEMCGYEVSPFQRFGDAHRRQRRLIQRAMGAPCIRTYHPLLEVETRALLHRLVTSPEDYDRHILRYAGALTLLVVYGHQVTSNDDEFLTLGNYCMDLLANDISPAPPKGVWAVDVFPFLKNIPDWVPFTGFKRKATAWRAKLSTFCDAPYAEVKQKMKEGMALPSFCSTLLEEEQECLTPEKEYDIKWAANSMFAASMDTVGTAMRHLILLMILFPDKFNKAREELDRVVQGRMPTFADRSSLPYVECVLSEVLRWSCPVPLNLPHRLMEDDHYKEYFIPKGSFVVANIMAMVRDERLFPDPEAFIPERYDTSVDEATRKARDPRQWIFGFGRRRCPGLHLVEASLWLALVSILGNLEVTKALDAHGNVIEPEVKFENMIFRMPNKFKCNFQPRSEEHASLILKAVMESSSGSR
ncbi:cytochrome P450 [Obba rivulosa]|uniref:Cytochrome P450 n=1 Tax=Obba rivulosa TaxID=1052685 RepID=A0A8E2ATM0_9APHY|nr:cytochrome P450 [Obba rivulosa]